jgi:type IV pilus assembly protein PilB
MTLEGETGIDGSETDVWREIAVKIGEELNPRKVLVLREEDPDEDFQLVSSIGLDDSLDWEDQVSFDLLVETFEQKAPRSTSSPFLSICAPVVSQGRVLGLLYAERGESAFAETELEQLVSYGKGLVSTFDPVDQEQTVVKVSTNSKDQELEALNSKIVFLLLTDGSITGPSAQAALKKAEYRNVRVEQVLVESGALEEAVATRLLAEHYELEHTEVNESELDPLALMMLSATQANRLGVLPIRMEEDKLVAATCIPTTESLASEIKQITGLELKPLLTGPLQLQSLLERYDRLTLPTTPKLARKNTDTEKKKQLDKGAESQEQLQRIHQNTFSSMDRDDLVGGRYIVKDELMNCRFSTLYIAEDRVDGVPVVLRRLELPDSNPDEYFEARLQILKEGRLLSRLSHQNLPRVQEFIEDKGSMYLVLEEVAGQTLTSFFESYETQPGPELVRRLLNQFLSVVDYLHSQTPPIIHRDLRPETILITPHGTIKIAEFGLAKMNEGDISTDNQTAFRSLGSPNYASPEQLLGEPSHKANDFYSIGAILYFVATGQAPPNSSERCFGKDQLLAVESIRKDFPDSLCRAISQLLDPQAESRPDSVQAIHELLSEEADFFQQELTVPQSLVESQDAHLSSTWQVLFGGKEQLTGDDEAVIDFAQEYRKTFGFIDISEFPITREVGRLLPETLCKGTGCICLEKLDDSTLRVAAHEPEKIHLSDGIFIATKGMYRSELLCADPSLIEQAVGFVFDGDHIAETTTWMEFLEQQQSKEEALTPTNAQAKAFNSEDIEVPIEEAVDRLLKEAIASGASDIHLEPFAERMNLRCRVDGVLHQINTFEPEFASSMIRRLKTMANMDIARERGTQRGRISIRVGQSDFDLRVSILPVLCGESCVMRVSKKGSFNLRLPDLGIDAKKEAGYRRMLSQPHGLILVCGPTGSGRSTTLYASLKEIQRPDRKVLTAEDPIEYQMSGITQVQMNTDPRVERRLTFANALREFMCHDPDVILVGEIQDSETANITIQAALTGHLMLSTIHTNDAIGVVTRLRDMGCEPFSVGSTLLGVLGQRLARRICPDCTEEIEVPASVLDTFQEAGIDDPKMFKGVGCKSCDHTGYQGQVALCELLDINDDLRALIKASASETELRAAADSAGFETLLLDGLKKVVSGEVTLEEMQRVCKTL